MTIKANTPDEYRPGTCESERDRYREALRLIHDGLADHPRWHDIAPRFDGPMDVAKVAAQALDTPPTSKEERTP